MRGPMSPIKHFERHGHYKVVSDKCTKKYKPCIICEKRFGLTFRRKAGILPREPLTDVFPCGHPRSESRRGRKLCLACHRANEAKRYQTNPSHYRELVTKRRLLYRNKWPEKIRARNAVLYAVRSGQLAKLPCQVCGDSKSQAHHPDYSKPLDVIWVCPIHHAEIHHRSDKMAV
jgi:hypothetical protein